jgi:5-(carboxyamino)imidazole ribonucleotide synthase
MYILDKDRHFPAGQVNPQFVEGDFALEEDVYAFGQDKDVMTIEIEHVAVEALERLRAEGVAVYPDPAALRIIKDKGQQKQFYIEKGLPTAPFELYEHKADLLEALSAGSLAYPFVQKSRTAGYDGRGVAVIRGPQHIERLLEGPCLTEPFIPMQREVSVVVVRAIDGSMATFPAVEMAFHEEANLVEMLLCPIAWSADEEAAAASLGRDVAEAFGTVGLLAVEMFQLKDGTFMINEVAPRPHNSGHHTIECCDTSQYEQHLRAITGLPLGSTRLHRAGAMVNLLGAPGHSGPAVYQGWDDCLRQEGIHIHLYGKSETRPHRKMGHVTITADTLEEARQKARWVQQHLTVTT